MRYCHDEKGILKPLVVSSENFFKIRFLLKWQSRNAELLKKLTLLENNFCS